MSWLDRYFRSGMRNVAIGGTQLPAENAINFVSGATAVDNPSQGTTDVTIISSNTSAITRVAIAGSQKPFEPILNFVSGATAVDNSAQSRVDVTVTGSGGIVKQVAIAGSLLPAEQTINFVSGASAVDNPGQSRIDVTVQAGYATIESGGSSFTQRPILNFVVGATVADNAGQGRTDVTIAGTTSWPLYATHTLTGDTTLSSGDSANIMYYFAPDADGHALKIVETSGQPRVIFIANTSGLTRNFTVQATGGGNVISVVHGTGQVLMYSGDDTIGYIALKGSS